MHPTKENQSRTFLKRCLSRTFSTNVRTSLAPFQALRIFFSLTIIYYHAAFYLAASLSSGAPADALINDFSTVSSSIFQVVYFGFRYGVDVFLFISGFFLAPKVASALQNESKLVSISRYLLLRWLRLAPMYIIVSLIHRLQGNGLCPNWTEVLQVANIFSSAHNRCIIVGWSTIIDFQSHAVVCLLALMAGNMRRLKCILILCVALSGLARVSYWYHAGFPAWPIMFTAQEAESKHILSVFHKLPLGSYETSAGNALRRAAHASYYPLYFDLQYRLAPCMIGFLTWVNIRESSNVYARVVSAPIRSVMGSIALVCADFVIVLNSHPDLPTFSIPASAFHEGFGSVIVVCGVSIVVMISCHEGQSGSPSMESKRVRAVSFLSCVWARVVYAMYVGHPILLKCLHWWGGEMKDELFTASQVLLRGSVLYMSTGMLSVVLCLFEQPLLEFREWVASNTGDMEVKCS